MTTFANPYRIGTVGLKTNFVVLFRQTLAVCFLGYTASVLALPFGSRHVLVVEESTGMVLLTKDADSEVPIASLTKLMTAMVVLDANQDMDEKICIEAPEIAMKRKNSSRVPLGVMLPRKAVLQLALMSSDNRAAASLVRAYPGGDEAFIAAVKEKLTTLEMTHTTIEESTGLSSHNKSTASDLVKMVEAAANYPDIARITTNRRDVIEINGRLTEYRNTNHLVGQKGWGILLSKTGFTKPAGRCLVMRLQSAGRTVIMVLLNANASSTRKLDALNVRRFLAGARTLIEKAEKFNLAQSTARQDTVQLAKTELSH